MNPDAPFLNPPPHDMDPLLLRAYMGACYRLGRGSGALDLRIGRRDAGLKALMKLRGFASLAGLTAHNPGSRQRGAAANARAQERLKARLARGKWPAPLMGRNLDSQGRWKAEPSLWVGGMPLEDALTLGAAFRQYAIVLIAEDAVPRLGFCALKPR